MYVIKRDGRKEPINIEQIRKQTKESCEGLDNTSYEQLELNAQLAFQDGITTEAIQQTLIKTAASMIDIDTPNYTYVAARLALYDLYHKIKHVYGLEGSGDVYKKVTLPIYIEFNKSIFSEWYIKYSKEEIEELNNYIVGTRDLLYDYTGFELLKNMYLAKNNGIITELPQHMHMAICMFCMQNENKDKRLSYVKEAYDMVSKLEYINATPINANGRLSHGGLISCLITTVEDDLDSIMDKAKEVAQGSKLGSGWGIDFSRVRSIGSDININKNAAGGKIPFLKVFNDIALAVDQNRKRPGAFAVYIECWDLEIFDFIDLRKTSGEERRRAHNLFLAITYNDLYMKREANDENWTLFDPKDVPMLTETYGDEFESWYLKYENEYNQDPSKFNPNTKVIKARQIMREHILSLSEVGNPFTFFKCNANKVHKYQEHGIIRSSNLCTEITLPTTKDMTAVCNLGSINLSKVNQEEDLIRVSKLAMRTLDNYIDLTPYPTNNARRFQAAYRSTGCGTMGEAEYIANKGIYYGSDEHKKEIDRIWKTISETLEATSRELAKEKGSCIVDGIRNAYRTAIAPNSSSAILAGTTNGIEPVYNKIWVEENKRGSFLITAPHITIDNYMYYQNPYEIDMAKQLEVNAIRQKYVDMGISQNLFLDPTGLSVGIVRSYLVLAWKLGLKSIYYLRSKPPKKLEAKDGEIICEGCVN